jgi:hypothetical protein
MRGDFRTARCTPFAQEYLVPSDGLEQSQTRFFIDKTAETKKIYRCSISKQMGHNAQTCKATLNESQMPWATIDPLTRLIQEVQAKGGRDERGECEIGFDSPYFHEFHPIELSHCQMKSVNESCHVTWFDPHISWKWILALLVGFRKCSISVNEWIIWLCSICHFVITRWSAFNNVRIDSSLTHSPSSLANFKRRLAEFRHKEETRRQFNELW